MPDQLFLVTRVGLETYKAVLKPLAYDFHVFNVAYTEIFDLAVMKVSDLVHVQSHDPSADDICGEKIRAGNGDTQIHRIPTHRSVSLHPDGAVNNGKILPVRLLSPFQDICKTARNPCMLKLGTCGVGVCQMKSMPCKRPHTPETCALGGAISAAVGAGLYGDFHEAAAAMTRSIGVFEPITENVAMYDAVYNRVFTKLYAALEEVFTNLNEIRELPKYEGA